MKKLKETFIFNTFAAYNLPHAAMVQSGDRTAVDVLTKN